MLLGDLLVARGLATADDVRIALSRQERRGGRIGENLIALGIISKDALQTTLREQYERATAILAREDLLARATRRFGGDHPQTNRQRCQLACALTAGGRPAEALKLAQTALAGHETALGSEHDWTKDSAQAVAEAQAALDPPVTSAEAALPSESPAVAAGI